MEKEASTASTVETQKASTVDSTKEYVWTVWGATGEYSDATEWIVCAYKTEAEARKHSECAQGEADALRSKYQYGWDIPAGSNKYDPQFRSDYTGTRYGFEMVEVRSWDTDYAPSVEKGNANK